HRAAMRRQLARLAAVGGKQIDLRKLVVAALRDERDRPAVGRPAGAGLVFGSVRELRWLAAFHPRAPDMRDAPAGLPVSVAPRKHDVSTVRRELRLGETRPAQTGPDTRRPGGTA